MRPFEDIDRLAAAPVLDRVAAPVRDAVHRVLPPGRIKDALHGVWMGHPLHPMLAQLSLGAFVSAGILDVSPRGRRPATVLIGTGLLAGAPTVAAGLADYADGHEEQQRVGVVHGAATGTMLAGYVGSLVARARGRSARGALYGWAALAVGSAGAALGGHMAYRQAMGANHAEGIPHIGPDDWVAVGAASDLADGTPTRRVAQGVPVVVIRRGDAVHALAEHCSHASAPLSQGSLDTSDGAGADGCLTCPWHGSVFRVSDGSVVSGPATAPQPGFDTRIRGDTLEVRVRTWPGVPAS